MSGVTYRDLGKKLRKKKKKKKRAKTKNVNLCISFSNRLSGQHMVVPFVNFFSVHIQPSIWQDIESLDARNPHHVNNRFSPARARTP